MQIILPILVFCLLLAVLKTVLLAGAIVRGAEPLFRDVSHRPATCAPCGVHGRSDRGQDHRDHAGGLATNTGSTVQYTLSGCYQLIAAKNQLSSS
jgi:hypothetical protein